MEWQHLRSLHLSWSASSEYSGLLVLKCGLCRTHFYDTRALHRDQAISNKLGKSLIILTRSIVYSRRHCL